MTSKIEFTRNALNLVAKSRGIKKLRSMSTDELINALYKYDRKREVENCHKKLLKINPRKSLKYKIFQNISKNDLSRVEEL